MGGICLEAQQRTQAQVDFIVAKAKRFERLESRMNDRQAQVIDCMFREGIDGFQGGLSANNYVSISKASSATTTRDLGDLVAMGALTAKGDRRYRRYYLAVPAWSVGQVVIEKDGSVSQV